jgi:hypothetical protein
VAANHLGVDTRDGDVQTQLVVCIAEQERRHTRDKGDKPTIRKPGTDANLVALGETYVELQ